MTQLAEALESPAFRGASPSLRIVMFYHSVISDWNNGNAHFLRGLVKELTTRGHHVTVYEPRHAWSMENLERVAGSQAEVRFAAQFPHINYVRYNPRLLQLDDVLGDSADVVVVHEWNDHDLVRAIGQHHRENPSYALLFHDTHHRSVTDPGAMAAYDLTEYDGVLAFGDVVRDLYLTRGWTQRAWTFHEAADVTLFHPNPGREPQRDVLWIGNWGDEERSAELHQYVFDSVRKLGLSGSAFGVRYPDEALAAVAAAGIAYGGWLANYDVPATAWNHRMMVHVPRRPYVEALPGIPTIRPFEALACGVPLVSSYWDDAEGLFSPGKDFLMARTPAQMRQYMSLIKNDDAAAREIAEHGLRTLCDRHTCGHRAEQFLQIVSELRPCATTQTPLTEPVRTHRL